MIMQNLGMYHLVINPPAGDWEPRICSSAICSGATWLVKRAADATDLWWVAQHPHDSPALIAAVDAVCPRCGSNLAITLDMEREPSWVPAGAIKSDTSS